MVHCEDTAIINRNMAAAKEAWGDDPPVALHALIRSEEACLSSTRKAVELARKYDTRLHVAHISTAEELELFDSEKLKVKSEKLTSARITAEVCVGHLLFSQLDHGRLGSMIKTNPAIKSPVDQYMLRQALTDGRIATVATDHAPHLLSQKEGGCARAASGMPMVQFSLVSMLELVDAGVLPLPRLVELMSHNPARLFGVQQRGFLREGYRADMVLVRPHTPWRVTSDTILSKCGWSPVEGHEFQWRVERTLCNGVTVYANSSPTDAHAAGVITDAHAAEAIIFNHTC
jgi:dihydroorotase